MLSGNATPVYACLCSLLAIIPILMLAKRPDVREGVTFIAGAFKLLLVLSLITPILKGVPIEFTFLEILPGLPLKFKVDGLGLTFAIVASSLWLVTSCYSIGYMRSLKEHAQTRYYACFALALSSTLGVAFSANLFTMYVFYEILSLSTFPLVTHHQDKEARTGGRTYLTYLLGTSIGFVLPAMIWCHFKTGGDMEFSAAGIFGNEELGGFEAIALILMFTFGFAKAGLMPFHSWLPGGMVAPTPVSALLHAVAVVKVGVFCVLRVIISVFGVDMMKDMELGVIISWIAGVTVIVSSLIALSQDNLKRRLAFSTIGQLGYIILAASLLSDKAVEGSIMHIAMHAFGKITLFFCAGAIYVATKKKYISQMVGIGRRMPITMACFFIGSMSVIGLPPTGGITSKWYMLEGAMQADNIPVMIVYLCSTILNAAYFLPIVYKAFFCSDEEALFERKLNEAPFACVLPICITSFLTITAFFASGFFHKLAKLMTTG